MLRVVRRGDRHDPRDLTISFKFEGEFADAFLEGRSDVLLPIEAIKNLEIAVALRPNADDYTVLARLNRALKRGRQALLAAEQGIKLEKDSVAAHLERAYALVLLNRAPEAITTLKRALEISPELRESLADAEELKPIAGLPAF